MIPADGPQDTESSAEVSVYYLLKRGLSDDFTVIHSLPWLAAAATEINGNSAPTGEIDFLVLHARLGILALEVKGGKYKVQGLKFVHTTKNFSISPISQVRKNIHGLATWLGADPSLRWKIHYGLIFPNSDFNDSLVSTALTDVTTNPPQKIFVDRQDFSELASRVNEIMEYWFGALKQKALGTNRLQKIIDAICPDFDGTPQWGSRVAYDKKMWLKLTAEQTVVVNATAKKFRSLVTGWPGTGKTIIATEVARQKLSEGKKVLFLTFNKLLSEHVQTQLGDNVNLTVLTWHSFCAKFARSNRKEGERSDDWLEAGCLRDFKEAVNQKNTPHYDIMLIDEAQTFRADWINSICQWHEGEIAVFCDATQVFSFERDRISLNDLCHELNIPQPFVLTIPLRSPKAIFDRLREVRPPNHQTYSPRELELDSLQEKLVVNMDEALMTTLSELARTGLSSSDIAVLSKFGWQTPGKQANGIFETVSRFRGLEASVVVICHAEKMDDLELFSAYSRATSVCIALYDAETLGAKAPESGFQQVILSSPRNAKDAQIAYQSAQTRGVLDTNLKPQWYPFNTIDIGWCSSWGGWLIARGKLRVLADLWMDYLLMHHPWPVFIWSEEAIREVEFYQPEDQQYLNFYNPLETLRCETCNKVTPQKRIVQRPCLCLFCSGFHVNTLMPQPDLIEKLRELDIVTSLPPNVRTAEQLKNLPLSLAAVALAKYANENSRRDGVLNSSVNFGSGVYRAAMAFVYSHIVLLSENKTIDATALAQRTYSSYTPPEGLSQKEWKILIDRALSVCYNNRKLVEKVSKGVYKPISKTQSE
ncbi:nuclease-related domain-containing DEAD/DEAH box helicase [Acidovorax sp. 106]|uniref:nuclease-related domain-containing DEAD/DEAH box helicase n=1 Tax=Acidovorax sp. 106 TaxID=2135637 RepID=UPI000F1937A0|nr:NERD domain-containing protein [Acidovorax sp. 106]RLJ37597.1 uncharacterized protein DUF2075 [Acidovorax sp. 106]